VEARAFNGAGWLAASPTTSTTSSRSSAATASCFAVQ
jgi:hypothetical protein